MSTSVWPAVDEAIEHVRELANVVEVQPRGRLVHDVELAATLSACRRQLARDLDALRLAAGERRRRLAESQVAESDLLQLPERLAELLLAREEPDRLVDGELEHVVDVLPVARARRARRA